jgi:hypothetical protein
MEELTNVDFFEEAPTSCSDCDMAVILTELKYKRRQYQSLMKQLMQCYKEKGQVHKNK